MLEYTNEPYAIAKIAGLKVCESFNIQYGTNYIAVMPTNLYCPNDNFDLERSHVLPALIRKIVIGQALETGNWDMIRADFNKRPVEGVNGSASEEEIIAILNKYGVRKDADGKWEVEIWGSGKPLREFLWSEEMADACIYIMERVDFKDTYSAVAGKEQGVPNEIRNCHINVGTGKEISIAGVAGLIKETSGFKGNLYFNAEKPDGTMRKLTDVTKLHNLGWHHKIDIAEGVERMIDWYKSSL